MILNNRCQLKNNLIIICFSTFFTLFFSPFFVTNSSAAKNSTIVTPDSDFPTYPSIKPNIEFWIDIFTKYSKAQGVIHDNRNLDIIYEVIDLDDSKTLRATRKK